MFPQRMTEKKHKAQQIKKRKNERKVTPYETDQ